MDPLVAQILVTSLTSVEVHLKTLIQLEAERIAKETGEPIDEVGRRIQTIADSKLTHVKAEFFKNHPQLKQFE